MAKAIAKKTPVKKAAKVVKAVKAPKAVASKKVTGPLAKMKAAAGETADKVKSKTKVAAKDRVKAVHARKDKVIAAIADHLVMNGENASDMKTKLLKVSNSKLLRLQETVEHAKKAGGRTKVVTAIATGLGKTKDKDFIKKLESTPLPQLVDKLKATSKKAGAKKAGGKTASK